MANSYGKTDKTISDRNRELIVRTYLARSAKLPEGLYILLMFFLYFFLVVAPGATLAQKPMVRSLPKFQDW